MLTVQAALFDIELSIVERWRILPLFIWNIIYFVDIKWIMPKELFDGSLDYTCTSIGGNYSERVLYPPFWPRYLLDAFG